MELYLNATSPYARLARILLLEKGLAERVSLCWCDPWTDDAALLEVNPAGRIPALLTDEGTALSESLLIAFYLDGTYPNKPMLPAAHLAEVLHLTGLGQNLMDAAFTTVIARKHYSKDVDDSLLGQRRLRALQRILVQLGQELGAPVKKADVHLGEIAIAVALDYLAFRLPEINWKNEFPGLESWYSSILKRDSFLETAFS